MLTVISEVARAGCMQEGGRGGGEGGAFGSHSDLLAGSTRNSER